MGLDQVYFVIQSEASSRKTPMKTLARIGAILSFALFSLPGIFGEFRGWVGAEMEGAFKVNV